MKLLRNVAMKNHTQARILVWFIAPWMNYRASWGPSTSPSMLRPVAAFFQLLLFVQYRKQVYKEVVSLSHIRSQPVSFAVHPSLLLRDSPPACLLQRQSEECPLLPWLPTKFTQKRPKQIAPLTDITKCLSLCQELQQTHDPQGVSRSELSLTHKSLGFLELSAAYGSMLFSQAGVMMISG